MNISTCTPLDASATEQFADLSRDDLIRHLLFLDGLGGEDLPAGGMRNGFRAAIDETERRYPAAADLALSQSDGDDEESYAQLLVRLSGEGE
mgnify:CR=1 FL=1